MYQQRILAIAIFSIIISGCTSKRLEWLSMSGGLPNQAKLDIAKKECDYDNKVIEAENLLEKSRSERHNYRKYSSAPNPWLRRATILTWETYDCVSGKGFIFNF